MLAVLSLPVDYRQKYVMGVVKVRRLQRMPVRAAPCGRISELSLGVRNGRSAVLTTIERVSSGLLLFVLLFVVSSITLAEDCEFHPPAWPADAGCKCKTFNCPDQTYDYVAMPCTTLDCGQTCQLVWDPSGVRQKKYHCKGFPCITDDGCTLDHIEDIEGLAPVSCYCPQP